MLLTVLFMTFLVSCDAAERVTSRDPEDRWRDWDRDDCEYQDVAADALQQSLLQVQMRIQSSLDTQFQEISNNSLLQLEMQLQRRSSMPPVPLPIPNTVGSQLTSRKAEDTVARQTAALLTASTAALHHPLPLSQAPENASVAPRILDAEASELPHWWRALARVYRTLVHGAHGVAKQLAMEVGRPGLESLADLQDDLFGTPICAFVVLPTVLVIAVVVALRLARPRDGKSSLGTGPPARQLEVPACWVDMPRRPGVGWGPLPPPLPVVSPYTTAREAN